MIHGYKLITQRQKKEYLKFLIQFRRIIIKIIIKHIMILTPAQFFQHSIY